MEHNLLFSVLKMLYFVNYNVNKLQKHSIHRNQKLIAFIPSVSSQAAITPHHRRTIAIMVKSKGISTANAYVCHLSSELYKLAEDELRETKATRDNALKAMREWIATNPRITTVRLGMRVYLLFASCMKLLNGFDCRLWLCKIISVCSTCL